MNKLLKDIYDCFYTPPEFSEQKQEVEECHQALIKALEMPERRLVLRIMDALGLMAEERSIDSFSNAAVVYGYAVNTLENRLKAKVCELCGTTESDHYEVHHINKIKNLKGKERWEIAMIAKHRKTLVVCRDCHRSIIHKK